MVFLCHREVSGEPHAELRTEPQSEFPCGAAGYSSVGGGSGPGGSRPEGGRPPDRPGQRLPQREHADIRVQVRWRDR